MENRKILYIEDDSLIMELFRASFEQFLPHTTFYGASTGKEGLEIARTIHPHLIMLDMGLPDMAGIDILIELKKDPHFTATPVIVVTGSTDSDDKMAALENGAIDFLSKPCNIRELIARITLHLRQIDYIQKIEEKNAQLEEDLEAGRKIQFKLLPPKQREIGPFTFNGFLFPSMHLSGDFLDYFPIDERYTGFYIADVSGHGVSSAFVTVFLKSFVQNALEQYHGGVEKDIINPDKLCSKLNRNLLDERLGKYMTAFYAVMDSQTNTLTYTIAGQYPFPIITHMGSTRYLSGTNVPLGLFPQSEYSAETISLDDIHEIILISDGVLEILPHPTLREKQSFLLNITQKTDITIDSLVEAFGLQERTSLPDDITFLLVQRRK